MNPSNPQPAGFSPAGVSVSIPQIVVLGAKGRMGQMVLEACAQKLTINSGCLRVAGAIEAPNSPFLGQPCGIPGIDAVITADLEAVLGPSAVVIDFTAPQVSLAALAAVRRKGGAYVLGTTGLSPEEKNTVTAASQSLPIMMAPNMSVGVTLLFKVAEMVAKVLGEDFDVEIVEAHHNKKKDSPSGTALGLAEAVARGHAVKLSEKAVYGREGLVGARKRGEIGIHAVRGGDIVGDHTVLFAGDGERIELKHMAHNRMTFAQGAVTAALFLHGKPNGMYNMVDVLGL